MTAFYFSSEEEPLFGIYAAPRVSLARNAAVLFCCPIGMEYQRSHYAIRLVALQLAAAGFHVLRFDYHGLGDSSGDVENGQFALWSNDIVLAARELFDVSGTENLIVVGLRMGAALAIEALPCFEIKAKGLVLWDPVVSGCEYLSSMEMIQEEILSERRSPIRQTDELLGARFPQDLRSMIQGMDLADRIRKVDVERASLIVSEESPAYGKLLDSMRNKWPDVTFRRIAEPARWNSLKAAFEGRMTGSFVRVVAEAVEGLA